MNPQPSLFERRPPPDTLPHRGDTVEARIAGQAAAVRAAARRVTLTARYMDLQLRRGVIGLTDHEASDALHCPLSSICSIRAKQKPQLAAHGHRPGPYGDPNTVYVLRIAIGARLVSNPLEEGDPS